MENIRCEAVKVETGWYWRVRARNGKTLCHSETYKRKKDCLAAAKSVCFFNNMIRIYIVDG